MPTQPRPLPPDLFAFSGAEKSSLYTAVLYAFGEANELLQTSLALEDVHGHLSSVGWPGMVDDAELVVTLDKLREWQLIDAGQNHSEHYRTAQEYERRNLQYSLTRRGEAALAGHLAALQALETAGVLQTAVLDAIADALGRLAQACAALPVAGARAPVSETTSEQRRVYAALQELNGHLDAMRSGIRTFNSDLQRLLRANEVDEEVFGEVKDATIRYLDEYVTRLDDRVSRIRRATENVRRIGVDPMLLAALAGADLPPHPRVAERDAEWVERARAHWSGLEAWFAPSDGAAARAEQLSATARRAIVSLLQVVDRMRNARRRPSSAQADLRRLAQLFATASHDDDLHRLWRAAFGLHPARHTHVGHADPDVIPRGTSWTEAEAVPVSALLRESGLVEKFARPTRVRDVSELRRERAERTRAERMAAERAVRALGEDGPVRISQLNLLDDPVFAALLDLLGRAVSRPRQAGTLRAVSSDGRVEITLRPPPGGARASIRTATGELDCPDYEITIKAPSTAPDGGSASPPMHPMPVTA